MSKPTYAQLACPQCGSTEIEQSDYAIIKAPVLWVVNPGTPRERIETDSWEIEDETSTSHVYQLPFYCMTCFQCFDRHQLILKPFDMKPFDI
jgi:hypothetical protein